MTIEEAKNINTGAVIEYEGHMGIIIGTSKRAFTVTELTDDGFIVVWELNDRRTRRYFLDHMILIK